MVRGSPDSEFYTNPNIERSLDAIYEGLDAWGVEVYPENNDEFNRLCCFVALPPLKYGGKQLKGVLFTDAADLLIERIPRLQEAFFVYGYTMWCSYSRSERADGIFTLYSNPSREAWWQKKHPHKSHKLMVPLLDTDFVHDYFLTPRAVPKRDIDILCVSRVDSPKNLPMLARALKVMRKKYSQKAYRCTWVTGREFDVNLRGFTPHEENIMRQVHQELGYLPDYIDIVPRVNWGEMPSLYSRAGCYVLASLSEGKNRGLWEAASCNTPVVCFADYNKYARGNTPVLPPNAGVMAPHFDAESLADSMFLALQNREAFRPREAITQIAGRRNVLNMLLDTNPYYRQNIPDYEAGKSHDNRWLDLAMVDNYGMTVFDNLYTPGLPMSAQIGSLTTCETVLGRFVRRFTE